MFRLFTFLAISRHSTSLSLSFFLYVATFLSCGFLNSQATLLQLFAIDFIVIPFGCRERGYIK